MKAALAIIACLITLTLSGCYNKFAGCQKEMGGDDNYCTTCQCADTNYGRNPCISNSTFCESFGNIGAR